MKNYGDITCISYND